MKVANWPSVRGSDGSRSWRSAVALFPSETTSVARPSGVPGGTGKTDDPDALLAPPVGQANRDDERLAGRHLPRGRGGLDEPQPAFLGRAPEAEPDAPDAGVAEVVVGHGGGEGHGREDRGFLRAAPRRDVLVGDLSRRRCRE